jgi:hypothetical protein
VVATNTYFTLLTWLYFSKYGSAGQWRQCPKSSRQVVAATSKDGSAGLRGGGRSLRSSEGGVGVQGVLPWVGKGTKEGRREQ